MVTGNRTTIETDATRLRHFPVQAAPVARSRVGAARNARGGIDPSWSFPKWVPDVIDWGLKHL